MKAAALPTPQKDRIMEGLIATWYTRNRGRDWSWFRTIARQVAERVPPGASVLDVATGPGSLAIEIARTGRRVYALDLSRSFVQIAREEAARAGVEVDVRHGSASAMPFPDACFDLVICTAAFKNFASPLGALNEMHRVLKPGGEASVHDLRNDATREDIDAEVRSMPMSSLNRAITSLIFRYGLIKTAYSQAQLEGMAAESRFGGCEIARQGVGFEVRLRKHAGD